MRREIEVSATSEKPSGGGAKIKSKRSFSKILSFSKKGGHPPSTDISSPTSATVLCVPLSVSKLHDKDCVNTRVISTEVNRGK